MTHARALAAAQTVPIRGHVEANLEQHLRLIPIAGREGASVVLFPEMSLTGYELDLARELAFTPDDRRLAPLVEAAASTSLIVIAGAPVRCGPRLHIGAFIIRPDRTIDIYTKHRLGAFGIVAACDGTVPAAEATVFEAGGREPLVCFNGHVGAVAVCADTGRPFHPLRAAARGARTYFASMFVIPSELARDEANMRTYAREHRMAVVMANFGGPTGGLAAAGRSGIWSDRGEPLVQLDESGAGVAVAIEEEGGWHAAAIMLAGC